MKNAIKGILRVVTPPLLRNTPISDWPGWLGRINDVKVPRALSQRSQPSASGAANINILIAMLERVKCLPGDVADCGVYRAGSTISMGLYLRQKGINKTIYGFDSFQGFDPKVAASDMELGGAPDADRHEHGFSGTSLASVRKKVARFGLENIVLVPGYFNQSFAEFPDNIRFCFAHLDVNLYESYQQCLQFFFPRLVSGGIILLDEYNDPPWPGCNKAVDEFLEGKSEKLQVADSDNYLKWYFVKR